MKGAVRMRRLGLPALLVIAACGGDGGPVLDAGRDLARPFDGGAGTLDLGSDRGEPFDVRVEILGGDAASPSEVAPMIDTPPTPDTPTDVAPMGDLAFDADTGTTDAPGEGVCRPITAPVTLEQLKNARFSFVGTHDLTAYGRDAVGNCSESSARYPVGPTTLRLSFIDDGWFVWFEGPHTTVPFPMGRSGPERVSSPPEPFVLSTNPTHKGVPVSPSEPAAGKVVFRATMEARARRNENSIAETFQAAVCGNQNISANSDAFLRDGAGTLEVSLDTGAISFIQSCGIDIPVNACSYEYNNSISGTGKRCGVLAEMPDPPAPPEIVDAGVADAPPSSDAEVLVSGSTKTFLLPERAISVGSINNAAKGPDGHIWFTVNRLWPNRILRIDNTGKVTEFPTSFPTGDIGGLATGPDNLLWYPLTGGQAMGRLTAAGTSIDVPLPPDSYPYRVAAHASGHMWFVRSNLLSRLSVTGVLEDFPAPFSGTNTLSDFVTGPDGNVWLASKRTDGLHVTKIGASGTTSSFRISTVTNAHFAQQVVVPGPGQTLWILNAEPEKIARIDLSGNVLGTFPIPKFPEATSAVRALGAASDHTGNLWFWVDGGIASEYAIAKMTTEGQTLKLPGLYNSFGPVVRAGDGTMWFAAGSSRFVRIVP